MIKRVPGRSRQRGKARVIGRVCLASVPNTPTRPLILDGDHDPGRGTRHSGTGRHSGSLLFSMRPDGSRARTVPGSRGRGPAQTGGSRRPASRSRTSRSEGGRASDRTGSSGSSTVIDFTGPQRVLEDPEPTVTGHRARHEPDDSAATSRSRRRVGWRKGSDVDEELWPVEEFGGVSDEQFWDDLATDKPLATTARIAQPGTAATRTARTAQGGTARTAQPGTARTGQPGTAATRRPPNTGPGTHPQPRLGPDDRTAIQPVQPGPQPPATSPVATQPYPAATQPGPIATRPVRAAHQPAESRVRSRTSAEEDPLTSPAYSLRPRGSVDGRAYPSSRRSADPTRGQYEAATGQETQAFSLSDAQAAAGGYPDGVPPFRQFDRPSHSGNGGRDRYDADGPIRSARTDTGPIRCDLIPSGRIRSGQATATAAPSRIPPIAPTRTRSSPTASRCSRRIPRPTDTGNRPTRAARPRIPGKRTGPGVPVRSAGTAAGTGARVRRTHRSTALAALTTRRATTGG